MYTYLLVVKAHRDKHELDEAKKQEEKRQAAVAQARYTHAVLSATIHTHYTHAVYTCTIHMQYTHAPYTCSIHMQYTQAPYTGTIHKHDIQALYACTYTYVCAYALIHSGTLFFQDTHAGNACNLLLLLTHMQYTHSVDTRVYTCRIHMHYTHAGYTCGIHMPIHMPTHMAIPMPIRMSIHMCLYTCLYTCLYACLYTWPYICLYTCLCRTKQQEMLKREAREQAR
jgi:hypothetical protein